MMVFSTYFWNGFQHALVGGGFALLFYRFNKTNDFKRWEYLSGLIMSSSALFFLPAHIGNYRSFIDRLYQFLHYPLADWDILLFSIDWHRFFVTHSLIIPVIVLVAFLHKPIGYRLGLGLCIGHSSHLVWDAITCSMYTPIVFLNDVIEIRGYWAKGWLILNGTILFGFAWFVTQKIQHTENFDRGGTAHNAHNMKDFSLLYN